MNYKIESDIYKVLNSFNNNKYYNNISKKSIAFELKKVKYNFCDFFYNWFNSHNIFNKYENIVNKYLKKFIYRLFIRKRIRILLNHFNHDGKCNYENQILNRKIFNIKLCAQFISYITNIYLDNVWLINNKCNNKIIYSKYENFNYYHKDKLENIFSSINYNNNDKNNNLNINELINHKTYQLDENEYQDIKKYLKIGNIVGLYYKHTAYHSVSLYESGIGGAIFDTTKKSTLEHYLNNVLKNFNNEKIIRENKIKNLNKCITEKNKFIISSYFIKKHDPLFVNSETNEPWNTKMIGKNIKFKFKDDASVKKLNFNTHLGIVADIIDGEPIILHNIEGYIYYHKFNYLKNNCNIIWVSEINDKIIDSNFENMKKFLNENYNNNSLNLLNKKKIGDKKIYYEMKNNKPYVLNNKKLKKCSFPENGCFLKENKMLNSNNKYYCYYNDFNFGDCITNLEYYNYNYKRKIIEKFNNTSKTNIFNIVLLIIIIILFTKS